MGRLKWFLFGSVFFVACGGAANIVFPYKWFHVSPITVWEFPSAKLLGDKPENDKLLSDCKPTIDANGKTIQKCGVIFLDELSRLIIDYKQTKQRVIDLEKQCGSATTQNQS